MKLKIGALVAIVVAGLLIVPPLLGSVGAVGKEEIVMQVDNTHAVVSGEVVSITTEQDAALSPISVNGNTMLPLRWLAEAMGLTAAWDDAKQATTLTDEKNDKTKVVFAVGDPAMTVGEETVTLDTPAILQNGVTYVPLRAIGEACGWNIHFVDASQGAFIFMDFKKKNEEPTQQQIDKALTLLGPSRFQLLADGLVARAGSGTVIVRGSRTELKNAEEKYQGALAADGVYYLPIESTMLAMGGSATVSEDGTACTITAADGTQTELRDGKAGKTEDASFQLYTDEDGAVYASAQALGAALGLQVCLPGNDVIALTVDKLDGYTDQQAYLAAVGADLPDKRPDIPDAKGYIALTFDDGPTGGADGLTVQLLDGLKERGAHATFFMCGYRIKDFHTHMDRYLADGHELGNHTMDHPERPILSKMSPEKIAEQVDSNSELIASYTGQKPTVMRPVGGSVSDNLKAQMKELGLPIINWSVDTLDWKYKKNENDGERIKNLIVSEAKDGDIVLMHDLYKTTVKGVLAAIDELQEQGYAFVTVHELAQIKGVTLEPGVVYAGFGDRKGYNG